MKTSFPCEELRLIAFPDELRLDYTTVKSLEIKCFVSHSFTMRRKKTLMYSNILHKNSLCAINADSFRTYSFISTILTQRSFLKVT